MAPADGPIACAVDQIDCGIGCDCELSISCNDQRFQVLLSHNLPIESSTGGSLLKRLDAAIKSQDDLEMDDVQEEIADVVCEACQPVFRQLAPVTNTRPRQADLQTFLNPQTFYLQLVINDGNAKVTRRDRAEPLSTPHYGMKTTDQSLPRFHQSEIQVLGEFRRNAIMKVRVRGEDQCCKLAFDQTRSAVEREFACLKAISDSKPPLPLRTPRLTGLIKSNKDTVIGILEEYVKACPEAPTLEHFDMESVVRARREKWASQIQESIRILHGIGVIWGDGKAANIIVDISDNAWIIDFGGSWTDGWVDKELAGTIQGDEQALRKILNFLNI
ncbi:MAG: hypothetical protein M1820_003654 [Bogoriella megaspora]|nr:MAG: hypothetical protein M1820_003654 [Bogoriella megaspora]